MNFNMGEKFAKQRGLRALKGLLVERGGMGRLRTLHNTHMKISLMTFAWYGHLKYKTSPLIVIILVSWAIAFLEYCFQVPANRFGHGYFSAAQLKTIQEVITLTIFAAF